MLKYSLKRLASSILTLFIIITVIFVLLRQMPIEGYFENFDKLDEVQIQNGLNQLGLNKPIHEQLIDFFANLFRGDLGKSIRYSKGDSISGIIAKKAPLSIAFGVMSMALSLLMGIPLGTAMARSKGKFWDKIGTVYIVFINAVPAAVYYIFIQMYGTLAISPAMMLGLLSLILGLISWAVFRFVEKFLLRVGIHRYVVYAIRILCTTIVTFIPYFAYHVTYGTSTLYIPVAIAAVYAAALVVFCIVKDILSRKENAEEGISRFRKVESALFYFVPGLIFFVCLQMFSEETKLISMFFSMEDPATWILPVFSMSLGSTASYAMWLRRYMVDEMNKDYVRLARAKGVSDKKIMMNHVFRNAFVPMIQYIPTSLLYTISGSIYIESLYSIPGMGGLLVSVITSQDNTMVQALVMIYSCIGIIGLLLGDLLMGIIDPRISFVKKEGAR